MLGWCLDHWLYLIVIGVAIVYLVVLAICLLNVEAEKAGHRQEIKDLHSKYKHEISGLNNDISQVRSQIEGIKYDADNKIKAAWDSSQQARTEADERIKKETGQYEKLVKYLEYRGLRWHLEI